MDSTQSCIEVSQDGLLRSSGYYGTYYGSDANEHADGIECTHCYSHKAYRSHRKNKLEFLRTRLTGMVPFRCHCCMRRFWTLIDPRDI